MRDFVPPPHNQHSFYPLRFNFAPEYTRANPIYRIFLFWCAHNMRNAKANRENTYILSRPAAGDNYADVRPRARAKDSLLYSCVRDMRCTTRHRIQASSPARIYNTCVCVCGISMHFCTNARARESIQHKLHISALSL